MKEPRSARTVKNFGLILSDSWEHGVPCPNSGNHQNLRPESVGCIQRLHIQLKTVSGAWASILGCANYRNTMWSPARRRSGNVREKITISSCMGKLFCSKMLLEWVQHQKRPFVLVACYLLHDICWTGLRLWQEILSLTRIICELITCHPATTQKEKETHRSFTV